MFTVNQLSTLAGVTPRTLRHYDAIGLLKPSRIGDNGYRYYGEESVLRLQQILLYRELELPLDGIKRIMGRRDFDVLAALEGHKVEIRKRIQRLERLGETVDETIRNLKEGRTMANEKMFVGFSDEDQARYEEEAAMRWDTDTVRASNKRWKAYGAEEKKRILAEGNEIYRDLVAAIPGGASGPKAQAQVARWRKHLNYFWSPNDDQLVGLAEMYGTDPAFRANFDKLDKALAPFMKEAVTAYVAKLKK
jgi:MerR family transcriptional regulator, thiopeptide resistance regulator